MTTDALVDAIMDDVLEVSSSDSTYTAQRARVLRIAQGALQNIWHADEWEFREVTAATMTLTVSTYSAVTPSDFHSLGSNGSLWIQNDYELQKADPKWINRLRKQKGTTTGRPQHFAISGQDSSTKRPTILFDSISDATLTLEIDYLSKCPTLVDAADSTNKLDLLPDEHAESVLKPAVIELVSSSQGDGRVIGELGPRGKAALAAMKAHRNQQLPDDMRLGDLGLRRFGMH
jgi:hypothetical protein